MTSIKIPFENLGKNSYKDSYRRPQSARNYSESRKNPILQLDDFTTTPKSMRAKVPGYMDSSRWLNERPKGKGLVRSTTGSSYNFISSQDLINFKPTKRIFAQGRAFPIPERACIRLKPAAPVKNPVLQTDQCFGNKEKPCIRIIDPRPSFITEYFNMRNSLPSSELGFKKNLFAEQNKSRVFDQAGVCDPFDSHRKTIDHRQSSVSDLLSYKYALPYRENKITEKI
ncbi:unnamed protein product [Blepharisma stoltei]|uniref:Uncharacterized protein n=1 Tax=Blepharisma stoltei TaxID=1481888 RepID=A0AAU9K3N9_9CILI|nr:unnamed protein product [Blepharisma stoltei]